MEKSSETGFKVTRQITVEQDYSLDALQLEKDALLAQNDKNNLRIDEIDALVLEAKSLGVKTKEESDITKGALNGRNL